MNKKYFLLLIFPFVFCCKERNVWEQQVSIHNCIWSKTDTLCYTIPANDTIGYYDILLNVRNRTDYVFSNLYLFITAEAPNGGYSIDTVSYLLAEENGKWLGESNSQYRDNRFFYRTKIRFPIKGDYTIKIRQGMRKDSLEGIANIGLELVHTSTN